MTIIQTVRSRGFSLVETLVAVIIFSLFIVITLGIFSNFFRETRRAKVSRAVSDTARTIVLALKSGLSQAVLTQDTLCRFPGSPVGTHAYSEGVVGDNEIVFKTVRGDCQGYKFVPGAGGNPGTLYQFTHITSGSPRIAPFTTSEVAVSDVSFRVYDDIASGIQPMVQVTMTVESIGTTVSVPPLKLQFATIVPRPL